MKITEQKKEVNIGQSVELSNVELLVLNTEVDAVVKSSEKLQEFLSGTSTVSNHSTITVKAQPLVNLIRFLQKINKDVISLDDAFNELFLSELSKEVPLTEAFVNKIVNSSIGSSMNDKESI